MLENDASHTVRDVCRRKRLELHEPIRPKEKRGVFF
jgi:hypothetical protein